MPRISRRSLPSAPSRRPVRWPAPAARPRASRRRRKIKLASGDAVDLKALESAMRHLLDSYIRADDSRVLSGFEDMTLVELIIARGEDSVGALPDRMKGDRRAVAETVENNVHRLIVDEMAVNPKYYERMSKLLDELIRQRREEVIAYEEYLKKVTALAKKVKRGEGGPSRPPGIDTPALRAIYDHLPEASEGAEGAPTPANPLLWPSTEPSETRGWPGGAATRSRSGT